MVVSQLTNCFENLHRLGTGVPLVDSSPPQQIAANLADNIFKCIFINEKFSISIRISLKLVPRRQVDNRPALVQVMAWRRTGDKPLPGTNADLIHWRTYAVLGGDELELCFLFQSMKVMRLSNE